jgi:hypothetical protein
MPCKDQASARWLGLQAGQAGPPHPLCRRTNKLLRGAHYLAPCRRNMSTPHRTVARPGCSRRTRTSGACFNTSCASSSTSAARSASPGAGPRAPAASTTFPLLCTRPTSRGSTPAPTATGAPSQICACCHVRTCSRHTQQQRTCNLPTTITKDAFIMEHAVA